MPGSLYFTCFHLMNINSQLSIDKVASIGYSAPSNVVLSQALGYFSIFCWMCVSIPQFYENWKLKSSYSVSLAFIMLWAIGDIFNFIGSLVQELVLTAIILAGYYLFSDFLLIAQVVYYRVFAIKHSSSNEATESERSPLFKTSQKPVLHYSTPDQTQRVSSVTVEENYSTLCAVLAMKFFIIFLAIVIPLYFFLSKILPQSHSGSNTFGPNGLEITSEPTIGVRWGALLGWISTFLFCAAKVPQIWLNYSRKSTEGLSIAMFFFCCLGNLTYIMSIVVYAHDLVYLERNLPWLMGAALPFFFDFTIIGQSYMYRDAPQESTCV